MYASLCASRWLAHSSQWKALLRKPAACCFCLSQRIELCCFKQVMSLRLISLLNNWLFGRPPPPPPPHTHTHTRTHLEGHELDTCFNLVTCGKHRNLGAMFCFHIDLQDLGALRNPLTSELNSLHLVRNLPLCDLFLAWPAHKHCMALTGA